MKFSDFNFIPVLSKTSNVLNRCFVLRKEDLDPSSLQWDPRISSECYVELQMAKMKDEPPPSATSSTANASGSIEVYL